VTVSPGEVLRHQLQEVADTASGTFAFYVHDLEAGTRAAVREREAFPAASLIKLPILLRLLEMVRAGEVSLEQPTRLRERHKTGGAGIVQFFHEGLEVSLADACTAMIALSDNTAANLLLDTTGIAPVNAMLARLGCRRTRLHRYFGKPEMPGPAGPSQAVPAEIGSLLELLVRRQMLTPDLCALALVMLRRQTHRALIPRYLPEGTPVAHKTGSLAGVRHDAGVFWRPAKGGARTAGGAGAGPPAGPMARADEGLPSGSAVVFVGMSRDVADRRWTVENEAEVAIARAARLAFEHTECR
jgi:beta-lactamase class A